MNMFEEARALRGMLNMCSLTQCEIAKKIGVSQSYVANKLRLLNFSDDVQKKILEAALSERHARVLLKLKDDNQIKTAIEKIKAMRLNVAASEALVDSLFLEEMSAKIADGPIYSKINKFERLIEESVKNLKSYGIQVKSSVDIANNKKYITICIYE